MGSDIGRAREQDIMAEQVERGREERMGNEKEKKIESAREEQHTDSKRREVSRLTER